MHTDYIKEQIGSNADIFTIFKNRMPTREITKVIKDQVTTEEDIISTRILWLSGLEEGKNKGLNIDSYSRFIYIHGTNEEGMLGKKASHGCVRMSNSDIINLCNRDICSALVYISSRPHLLLPPPFHLQTLHLPVCLFYGFRQR